MSGLLSLGVRTPTGPAAEPAPRTYSCAGPSPSPPAPCTVPASACPHQRASSVVRHEALRRRRCSALPCARARANHRLRVVRRLLQQQHDEPGHRRVLRGHQRARGQRSALPRTPPHTHRSPLPYVPQASKRLATSPGSRTSAARRRYWASTRPSAARAGRSRSTGPP